jgi:lipopolysaccharide export system protein LptC
MMALTRADNLHSRLVFWLKIALPLVALALLATLFLFGRPIRPEDAIPYASTDITDRAKDPRVTEPVFASMTSDGAALPSPPPRRGRALRARITRVWPRT